MSGAKRMSARRRGDTALTSATRPLRTLLFATLVFICLGSAGLFHTRLRIQVIRLGYALSKTTSAHRTLLKENARLKLEVATLEAPARIERLATRTLGMRPPRPGQVVVIPEPVAVHLPPRPEESAHASAEIAVSPIGVIAAAVEVLRGR